VLICTPLTAGSSLQPTGPPKTKRATFFGGQHSAVIGQCDQWPPNTHSSKIAAGKRNSSVETHRRGLVRSDLKISIATIIMMMMINILRFSAANLLAFSLSPYGPPFGSISQVNFQLVFVSFSPVLVFHKWWSVPTACIVWAPGHRLDDKTTHTDRQ